MDQAILEILKKTWSQDQVADVGAFFDPIHRLRTLNEALFSSKSQTFGLGQTIWADKFWGIQGCFCQFISTHFGTVSPLSMLSINQSLFLQKTKPLYSDHNYLFGIGI